MNTDDLEIATVQASPKLRGGVEDAIRDSGEASIPIRSGKLVWAVVTSDWNEQDGIRTRGEG